MLESGQRRSSNKLHAYREISSRCNLRDREQGSRSAWRRDFGTHCDFVPPKDSGVRAMAHEAPEGEQGRLAMSGSIALRDSGLEPQRERRLLLRL